MAWLHTWAGVVIGSLLFAIFWMGSLSVFDREIDRWMMPATRLQAPAAPVSLDATVLPAAGQLAAGSAQWLITLPTDRTPTLQLRFRDASGELVSRHINPATGAATDDPATLGGTGFIFPFHFRLHLKWKDLGYWLVGVAGMAMLVLLVSGVVIHKKIFADFFTFRPRKHMQRASLDLHNLSAVLLLPFYVAVALSGLVILFSIYWPSAQYAAYPGAKEPRQALNAEAFGQYKRAPAGQPGTLASLDAMVARAENLWSAQGQRPGPDLPAKAYLVRVFHPGDANAYVEVRRSFAREVTMNVDTVFFDGPTGRLLKQHSAKPVLGVQRFLAGLHFIQFEHWTLRWLYFLAGLSGCVMMATGFLFWLEARRAQHAKKGLTGVRWVEALTIGSVTGLMIATLTFLIANRLLPAGASAWGADRAGLEVWVFFLAWLASLAHAVWRQRAAWLDQVRALAALAALAVALNWLTTGHHLLHTLRLGLWGVAGVDAWLLAGAGLAWGTARHLARKPWAQRAAAVASAPVAHHA